MPATPHNADTDVNSNEGNLLAALFLGLGMFNNSVQAPITQPIASPPPGVNLANGTYRVRVLDCQRMPAYICLRPICLKAALETERCL